MLTGPRALSQHPRTVREREARARRAALRKLTAEQREAKRVKIMQRKRGIPFKAALMYAKRIADMRASMKDAEFLVALRSMLPLRHRGHGRGFATGVLGRGHFTQTFKLKTGRVVCVAWPVQRSKYVPHQGARELLRRVWGGFAVRRVVDAYIERNIQRYGLAAQMRGEV